MTGGDGRRSTDAGSDDRYAVSRRTALRTLGAATVSGATLAGTAAADRSGSAGGESRAVQDGEWGQVRKLVPEDLAAGSFGEAVAVSGSTAAVTAQPGDFGVGAAYVYEYDGERWRRTARLAPEDGDREDQFGNAVDVSGSTVVVGCRIDENENGFAAGAAYVFERTGDGWGQTAKLLAGDGQEQDYFGSAVAVSGQTAVVTTERKPKAYVFDGRRGWEQTATLTADDIDEDDRFGESVSVNGPTVAVGASLTDVDGEWGAGAVHVFDRRAGWRRTARLVADDGGREDYFGDDVAVSRDGRVVLVGAPRNTNENGSRAGAAYVYGSSRESEWRRLRKLAPDDVDAGDQFGDAVDLGGPTAVVSAYGDDTRQAEEAGSVSVFEADGWDRVDRVVASDGEGSDGFASDVGVSGATALVNAFGDDGPGDDFRGAAYLFGGADGPAPAPGPVPTLEGGSGGSAAGEETATTRGTSSTADDEATRTDRPDATATTVGSGSTTVEDGTDGVFGGRDWSLPTEWVVAAVGGGTAGAYWLGNRRSDDEEE